MSKSNKEYWEERFTLLEKALDNKSAACLRDVNRVYKKAIGEVEKDLAAWYQRYATNEQITLGEAKKILDKGELSAFKMSVEEYIAKGESLDPQWRAELERASVRVHVTRLEALKLQMQQQAEDIAAQMSPLFDAYAHSTYKDQYYRTAFEIQKGLKVGWDLKKLDTRQVESVIYKPWAADGVNFSERIWNNRTKLVNTLHSQLTSAIARGEAPDKTIAQLSKTMNNSQHNAARVVMTESAFFNSAAKQHALKDLDVEKYEILATLDRVTSQICRDLDGKVFDIKDYKVGETAPPFHVWCRTTTVPYFDDEEGFRASRGDDGKYYVVPEDMTYHEWENTFVDGISSHKDKLTPVTSETLVKSDFASEITKLKETLNSTRDHGERDKILQQAGDAFIKKLNDPNAFAETKAIEDRIAEIEKRKGELAKADQFDFYKFELLKTEARELSKKIQHANANAVKSLLNEVRETGFGGSLNVDSVLSKSRSSLYGLVKDTYQYYPREWLKKSAEKFGPLKTKKVGRGYFSSGEKTIAISNDSFNTTLHELGHSFEASNDAILKAEEVFFERRTKGLEAESLSKLTGISSYRSNEKAIKDNFLNPYMGKSYRHNDKYIYFELVSMGFDLAYSNPKELLKDEDMARFIYGVLMLL